MFPSEQCAAVFHVEARASAVGFGPHMMMSRAGQIDHRANDKGRLLRRRTAAVHRTETNLQFTCLLPNSLEERMADFSFCGLRPVFDLRQQRGLDPRPPRLSFIRAASATPNENRRRFKPQLITVLKMQLAVV